METITPIEFMELSKRDALKRCKTYLKEARDGKKLKVNSPKECPMAAWVAYNGAKCNKEMVANIASCPICGLPICPDCGNHAVEQLSRVTGYLSGVSGWNAAKKQEFLDRDRHNL